MHVFTLVDHKAVVADVLTREAMIVGAEQVKQLQGLRTLQHFRCVRSARGRVLFHKGLS